MARPSSLVLQKPKRLRGTLAGLAASLSFAGMNLVVRHSDGALGPAACLAARGVVGAVMLTPWVWREAHGAFGRRGWPLWLQCLGGAMAALALFHNVNGLGVGQAIALSYLAPVMVALVAPVVYHERMTSLQAGGIATMIAGAGALQLSYAQRPPAEALSIGLLGASCGAVSMMALKRAAREHSPRLACWTFCLCSMGTAALVGTAGAAREMQQAWGLALAVGSLGTTGQLLLSWSFKLLPAGVAGALSLTTLLLSVLLESAYTERWPSAAQYGGYALLCSGLLLLQLRRVGTPPRVSGTAAVNS